MENKASLFACFFLELATGDTADTLIHLLPTKVQWPSFTLQCGRNQSIKPQAVVLLCIGTWTLCSSVHLFYFGQSSR